MPDDTIIMGSHPTAMLDLYGQETMAKYIMGK
jgi:hypothetical protein